MPWVGSRARTRRGAATSCGEGRLRCGSLVLFTTRYLDAAVAELRAGGYEVRDADAARLSPFVRHHVNMLGRYSFLAPGLAGGLRSLHDPSEPDEEEIA